MKDAYAKTDISIPRVLLYAIVSLGLMAVSTPAPTLSTTHQQATPFPLEGEWYTYANGDDILALATEGDILWAGTRAGGVVRWDTTTGTFVQFLKPQDGLGGNTVRDIFIDAQGNKWFATDGGLSILNDKGTADKSDDDWFTYTRENTNGVLTSNLVTAVAGDADRAGVIWIGMSQYWSPTTQAYWGGGIAQLLTRNTWDPDDDRWLQVYTLAGTIVRSREVVLRLASDNVTDILPVPGNRVWVATQKHWDFRPTGTSGSGEWRPVFGGLSRLDHAGTPETDDDVWQAWTCEDGPQRDPGVSCIVNQLQLDTHGYVWATMQGRGVIAFPSDGARLDYVRFYRIAGLATNNVESIVFGPPEDPRWQDTVWLSTYDSGGGGRGVCVLNHNGTIQDQQDDMWNEPNPAGGCLTTTNGLADNRVQAMLQANGAIWMGTGGRYGAGHGISVYNLQQQNFQEPLTMAGLGGMPYNYVTDIAVGQPDTRWENKVWVATGNKLVRKYGAGALLLYTWGTSELADDIWIGYTKEGTDDNGAKPWAGLASNNITALAVDGDNIWFGTQPVTWEIQGERGGQWTDGGLSVFDGQQWTIRTAANSAGLLNDSISALAVGCEGEVWIGLGRIRSNSGLGIVRLDTMGSPHNRDDDRWSSPIQYNTLPSNLVTDMAADCEHGQIWIATVPYQEVCRNCQLMGGGVGRYRYDIDRWTWWTADDGIETYVEPGMSSQRIRAEVRSIAVGPDGTAWAGAWGTHHLSSAELLTSWPFVPAPVNWFQDGVWSNHVFERGGWVSTIAIDRDGTAWVGTSRGGLDADGDGRADGSFANRAAGGIHLTRDGTDWLNLTPENSPLVTNDIEVIRVAPNGDVWIGTNGWGLMRFDPYEPPTPTPTVTATPTETATPTTTLTPTPTASPSPTETPLPVNPFVITSVYLPFLAVNWFAPPVVTPIATPTPTPSATTTPTVTVTPTPISTPAQVPSATPTPTSTPTSTPSATLTLTSTPTQTATSTQAIATDTPTVTLTLTFTPIATSTATVTPTPAPAAWCPGPHPACAKVNLPVFPMKDLYDITFTDPLHGFIVGEDGFIAQTWDGGNNWVYQILGTATLRDISMVDRQVGFIAGDDKTVLRTTNGGDYFIRMPMPAVLQDQQEDFWAINTFAADRAWALGHRQGTLLHLDGQEWQYVGWTGHPYTGLAMPAPDQGWAITEDGNIYRYTVAWAEFASIQASSPLRAIAMYSPADGWAAGDDGVVVHHADGQWTESQINTAFNGGGITGLYVRAPNDVWATATIGTGDQADGAIYRFDGNRWHQETYTYTAPLNAIWVSDTLTSGWAVGNEGFVMRYVEPPDSTK